MILAYKYRLKDRRAIKQLSQLAWAANQVWNFCVATQKETQRRWRLGYKTNWLSHFDFNKLTSNSSKELGIHAQSINSVCDQFVKSRDQHRACPKFRHSNGSKRSLGWVPFQAQSRKINGNSITYLGHTYKFFGAKRRPLPEKVKGGVFAEDGRGRWYVIFYVETEKVKQPIGLGEIGIDLGLKTLATCSDGHKIENPKVLKKYEKKLATAQRAGNKHRVKAIHAKIKNTRRDFLHKTSFELVKNYTAIAVGNVSSSKLAKTKMAKSVLDAGWSTFRNMLRYKASRHGVTYLEVDEKFTTQICSHCGCKSASGRPKGIADLGIREWQCSECGVSHDRDVNAAKNILAISGLSAQPRADGSRLLAG